VLPRSGPPMRPFGSKDGRVTKQAEGQYQHGRGNEAG
jgi:hypothetical protein